MWKKISSLPVVAYLALTGFVRDFKNDERGLSNAVVAVLLILIAVLVVVAIWGFLDGWLAALWDRITSGSDKIKEFS